jgi:hypothetical protein
MISSQFRVAFRYKVNAPEQNRRHEQQEIAAQPGGAKIPEVLIIPAILCKIHSHAPVCVQDMFTGKTGDYHVGNLT